MVIMNWIIIASDKFKNEVKEIEDLIKQWNEKIAEQEDAYFKKFSQMEVALSKLQSQTNSLSGLLGQ